MDKGIRGALIRAVREAARAEIMPRFRRLASGDVAAKTSATDLVTLADTRAEAHIRAAVARILPEARCVGEEGVAEDPTELDALGQPGVCVVIDPVDGTWNFAHGLATFGTLLAVVENGATIFGLLYDPVLDDWIEATAGGGTWYVAGDGRTRLTLGAATPAEPLMGVQARHGLSAAQWQASVRLQGRFAKVMTLGASLWEYRTLLTGGVGFIQNRYLKPWDHAAGVLALKEAGGYAALLDGTPYVPVLRDGYLLCARSEALWHELAPGFADALLGDAQK